jgi:hypothetical protein
MAQVKILEPQAIGRRLAETEGTLTDLVNDGWRIVGTASPSGVTLFVTLQKG